jgi:hypothetical protein
MVGYYFVYLGLRFQANTELVQRLDSGAYTEDETITFKIPLSIPYWMDSNEAERVNGEFVRDGEFYKLVKQQLKNDTLHIVCIRDHKEEKNFNFMAGFAKLSTDLPISSKQTLKLFGSLLKDFIPTSVSMPASKPLAPTEITYIKKPFNVIAMAYSVFSPPPDFIS